MWIHALSANSLSRTGKQMNPEYKRNVQCHTKFDLLISNLISFNKALKVFFTLKVSECAAVLVIEI